MQELSMISTSLPLGIHDFIQDVFSAIPLPLSYQVCLWDGTMLKEQVASSVYSPLKVTIRHPGVIRSLILKRDLLVLADAYLNGYLDLEGDAESLVLLFRNFPALQLSLAQKLKLWGEALSG
jgi:cyclopropane-fatty-acyl-phospholipid synthase